jgi:hypothetical protein
MINNQFDKDINMRQRRWLWITLVFYFAFAQAQPPIHGFTIDNNSSQHIYVWVTIATNVMVPGVNKLPYQIADIEPNTLHKKINFSYTRQWDDKTALALTFCSINAQSCLDSVGEYSSLAITPDKDHPNQWRVSSLWSAMMLPNNIKDNIVELDNISWSRDLDFPVTIAFSDAHKKRK